MKKISLWLLLVLVAVIFTGCNDDAASEPVVPPQVNYVAPLNVIVTPGSKEVYLCWSKVDNAVGYKICSMPDKTVLATVDFFPDVYTLKNLVNNKEYKLAIKAVYQSGESDFSNTVTVTPKLEYLIVIPETTKPIPSNTIESVQINGNDLDLILNDATLANSIKVNDIIIINSSDKVSNGLLVKVLGVKKNNRKGVLSLLTQEASVDEMISEINYKYRPEYGFPPMYIELPDGTRQYLKLVVNSKGEQVFCTGEFKPSFELKDETGKPAAKINVTFKLSFTFNFELNISLTNPNRVLINPKFEPEITIDFINEVNNVKLGPWIKEIIKIKMPTPIPVGPIKLDFVNNIALKWKTSVDFNLPLINQTLVTCGVKNTTAFGVKWVQGQGFVDTEQLNVFKNDWKFGFPVIGFNDITELFGPTPANAFDVSVKALSNLIICDTLSLYGADGPYIDINSKLPEFILSVNKPNWQLNLCLDNVKVGFDTKLMRRLIKSIPSELSFTFPVNLFTYTFQQMLPPDSLKLVEQGDRKKISFVPAKYGTENIKKYLVEAYNKSTNQLVDTMSVNITGKKQERKPYYFTIDGLKNLPANVDYRLVMKSKYRQNFFNTYYDRVSSESGKVEFKPEKIKTATVSINDNASITQNKQISLALAAATDKFTSITGYYILERSYDTQGEIAGIDLNYLATHDIPNASEPGWQYLTAPLNNMTKTVDYTLNQSLYEPGDVVYKAIIIYYKDTSGKVKCAMDDIKWEITAAAPTIAITAPANNASITPGSTVAIKATAAQVGGTIKRVEFYIDGVLKNSDTASPYEYSWATTGYANGQHVLKAKAVNNLDVTTAAEINVNLTASTNNMVFVEGGTFQMGEIGIAEPVHSVVLANFYIGKYEVTQAEWVTTMGTNPSYFTGDLQRPVEQVSWYDIMVYCNKRSIAEGKTPCYTISGSTNPTTWGAVPTNTSSTWDAATCNWSANGYRLPSEAEWEYAARGGKNSQGYTYSGSNTVGDVAWYYDNSGNATHTVGTKAANELGIYDMSGNVWEWNWDWYESYSSSVQTNPHGATSGSYRVLRGGFCFSIAYNCRVANRGFNNPYNPDNYYGFRLARTY